MPRITGLSLLALCLVTVPAEAATEGALSGTARAMRAATSRARTLVVHEAADFWITLKTRLALLADEGVKGLDVSIDTRHRVITLRGKVDSEAARQAADRAARAVEGQRRVIDEMIVVPELERPAVDQQDAHIVRDVKSRLRADASLKDSRIAVRSDGGIVTLTGRTSSLETSVYASEDARRVSGVRAVYNDLSLTSQG